MKVNTLYTLLFSALLFSSLPSYGQDDEEKPVAKKGPAKRNYTEAEFQKAVVGEMEKKLKRLGRDKLIELSKELLQKDDALKVRELEVEKKHQQLSINEADFEKRLKKFQNKQNEFLGCLDKQDKLREKRINHMVDVIAGMKPAQAAQILSVQETEISIQILGRLDATKVSKIFNTMSKEISARLQKQYMSMKK